MEKFKINPLNFDFYKLFEINNNELPNNIMIIYKKKNKKI